MIIGTSAKANADVSLIKAAGIGWVRQVMHFPFMDRMGGTLTEKYLADRNQTRAWQTHGLKVMGVTPLPGGGTWKPDASGLLRMVWRSEMPTWFGTVGSREYARNYQELCGFLAAEFKGAVQMWQVANELDIELFAGPLDLRQACDLMEAGARGLKEADPWAVVGANSVYDQRSFYLYGRLFRGAEACMDYCGVDSYFGSWCAGGPEKWDACIAELVRITGAKVLVNEWGFASGGEVMSREERDQVEGAGTPACQFRKWQYGWREGHSEKLQADFVREVFKVLRKHREDLLGAFFYRWEDQERCWQCGKPDCPLETAWGMVTCDNRPKAAYEVFKDKAQQMARLVSKLPPGRSESAT